MTVDAEQLSAERGDSDLHRLAIGGDETRFRGWHLAVGRESPTAAGIRNEAHVYVTRDGEIVVGLRVDNTGPNGPIRDTDYRAFEVFDDLDAALDWLDERCPWTEAVADLQEELAQAEG